MPNLCHIRFKERQNKVKQISKKWKTTSITQILQDSINKSGL